LKQRDDWHLTNEVLHEPGRGDPFAAAVRATRMPMVVTDPRQHDNPIVFCNEAFQRLTGYERQEIIGRNCRFLQGPETDPAQVARVREAIEAGVDISVDVRNYRKDGSTFWNALYLSPVRAADGEIQFFFASQLDVTDRVEAQRMIAEQKEAVEREVEKRTAALAAALEAKTLLLHEVDHRVKNNLMMIGALIRLQARRIADPQISDKLNEMLERVDALATVHRQLYQSEDVTKFDIGSFAANLAADIIGSTGRDDIRLDARIDRVDVPSNLASALGLILNEVLTNALKHGYANGRAGLLRLVIEGGRHEAAITVSDDGPGMPATQQGDGLGRNLIERLSRQIRAETRWSSSPRGTSVSIRVPIEPS